MKRILSLILALALAMSVTLVLAEEEAAEDVAEEAAGEIAEEGAAEEEEISEVPLMTYADYALAEIDAPVYVETYVQATKSWWNDKITVYCQSEDGAYQAGSRHEDRCEGIQERVERRS